MYKNTNNLHIFAHRAGESQAVLFNFYLFFSIFFNFYFASRKQPIIFNLQPRQIIQRIIAIMTHTFVASLFRRLPLHVEIIFDHTFFLNYNAMLKIKCFEPISVIGHSVGAQMWQVLWQCANMSARFRCNKLCAHISGIFIYIFYCCFVDYSVIT